VRSTITAVIGAAVMMAVLIFGTGASRGGHFVCGRPAEAIETLAAAEAEVETTDERFFLTGLRALREQVGQKPMLPTV
jgi:hypothetical protein